METLEFRLLGRFEVRRGERVMAEGGGKPQTLLAWLLISANMPVSASQLASAMWGEHQPASAANLVQGYISQWRGVLDPGRARRSSGDRITSTTGGYRLQVEPDECDLLRFTAHAGEAREAVAIGDLYKARRLLRAALHEWRGPALVDFATPSLGDVAARLEAEWLDLIVAAADVELRLGRPAGALTQLAALPEEHPLREQLAMVRMLALYRLGRQGEALAVFDRTRTVLAEELGEHPGPDLARMHVNILRRDPALQGPHGDVSSAPVLPARLSSFIGREQLQTTVLELVENHRIVSLTGPAGSGKTRLAIEVAGAVAAYQDRQVHFVDLSPVDDVALMWSTVAGVLGRPPPVSADPEAALTMLPSDPLLLVLDNMEQVAGAAPHLAMVLASAPLLCILATTREPLGISGEKLIMVPPLALPDPASEHDAARQLRSPAVRLFVERAQDLDPDFRVADQEAAIVAGICRRLDGLPLALELAAPWTRTLSLRALLERLDQPMTMLANTTGETDRPGRHRTLRAAIDWSYSALSPPQRRLLGQLSLFRSGASLQGVEAVSDLGAGTLGALADLNARNLIYRAGTVTEPRYRLLETIRDYARARLAEDPAELAAARERHARYICALGEEVARAAHTANGALLVRRLEGEQEEVRSVLAHLSASRSTTQHLSLTVDCLPLWWDLGHTREGFERLTDALHQANGSAPDDLLAAGHAAAVYLADASGQSETGLALGQRASALARRSGSVLIEALALCLQGNTRFWMHWATPATEHIALLEQARDLALTADASEARWGWTSRPAVLTTTTLTLADALRYRDAVRARQHITSLLQEPDRANDAHTESFVQRAAGALDADQGRWDQAEERLSASLRLADQALSQRSQSRSLEELARLSWARGDLPRAADFADRSVQLSRETGHELNWARCSALAADIALEHGDLVHAADLLDALVQQSETQFTATAIGPRRARLARLSGREDDAARHLQRSVALELAAGLTPDRTVYLVEAVLLAVDRGDEMRAEALAAVLDRDALQVGITIPGPERRRLKDVHSTTRTGQTDVV